jgi:hypothetical protein
VNRGIQALLWSVIALVLWVGIVWAAIAVRREVIFGEIHLEADTTVTVDRGDRFSLAVRDRGPSVGDHWTLSVAGTDVLTRVEERHVSSALLPQFGEPLMGGGDGTLYVIFTGAKKGTTTVTLSNCFQGCRSDDSRGLSRSVTWTVTVE